MIKRVLWFRYNKSEIFVLFFVLRVFCNNAGDSIASRSAKYCASTENLLL